MNLSRRNLLATATTTALAASVPAIANTNQIDGLWQERRRILDALGANGAAYSEAMSKLPAWAAPGLDRINSEGNRCGRSTGWPEVENPEPPEYRGATKLIRVAPYDVRRAYDQWLMIFGNDSIGSGLSPESRAKGRARYRQNMRTVIARIREQRRLEDELGITALTDRCEALTETLFDVERSIREVAASGDLNAAAAAAIAQMAYDEGTDDCVPQSTVLMLRAMLPSLRGKVAADVAELLAEPDKPISAFPFVMQELSAT